MYTAYVERVRVSPHPNADRLNIGTVLGEVSVIGKETKDNELVIYFPCDGRLSDEFLLPNDLVSRVDSDGKRAGGFFAKNGRIRAQNFRGVKSEGFISSLDMLEKAGVSEATVEALKEGDRFVELDGIPICEKYETPATKSHGHNQAKSEKFRLVSFKEHKDTRHILRELARIDAPCLVTVTEKMHGTSARYGCVPVQKTIKNGFFRRLLRKPELERTDYELVMGSRRVTLDPSNPDGGFYGTNQFRTDVFKKFAHMLKNGEVVYGEIVGYLPSGRPLMGEYSTGGMSKEFQAEHGDTVVFNYGCVEGQFSFYVYRMTMVNNVGDEVDLPWLQVEARAKELGLKCVATKGVWCQRMCWTPPDLAYCIDTYVSKVEGEDFAEGIVFRIDDASGTNFYKYKTFDFRLLEGILKEDPRHVDIEESS